VHAVLDSAEKWLTPSPPPFDGEEFVDIAADAPGGLPRGRGSSFRAVVFKAVGSPGVDNLVARPIVED
jgi:hypothetical protein